MKCFYIVLILLLCYPWQVMAQWKKAPSIQDALHTIKSHKIAAHIKFLADDLLDGRGIGTRGGEIGIKYIAGQFEEMGLLPGGENNNFTQRFPMVGIKSDTTMGFRFQYGDQCLALRYYEDFLVNPGVQLPEVSVEDAELVFVGFGIQAPEYNWDDFKDKNVAGKILLIMNNDPDTGDPNFFGGKTRLYYGRWTYKYEMAAAKGALGAIIIHTTPSAGYPWQVLQTSRTRENFELPQNQVSQLQIKAWATEDATKRLLKMTGLNLTDLYEAAQSPDFEPIPLGIKASIMIKSKLRNVETANVLGLLPRSDSEKKDEAVVFVAHHDHLGIGRPVKGDSIYNGALDNASGVATMLTIAQAFTQLPQKPNRSILFIAVAAEESGLLGSRYYAEYPTFPPTKIAAVINIDAINIWGRTRDLTIIGYGKTNLDAIVNEIAEQQQRVVFPDQFPEQGYFYRSDQFSFAKIGVPAIYIDNGLDFIGKPKGWGKEQVNSWISQHYHQPSDEYLTSWDLSGAVEDAQLMFLLGLKIANHEQMPQWMPGDEFEKIRKRWRTKH